MKRHAAIVRGFPTQRVPAWSPNHSSAPQDVQTIKNKLTSTLPVLKAEANVVHKLWADGSLREPGLLDKNTTLGWTDGLTAKYIKANFQQRANSGLRPQALRADLSTVTATLHAKNCRIGPLTLSTVMSYMAKVSMTRQSISEFIRYRPHQPALCDKLCTALVVTAARSGRYSSVSKVLQYIDSNGGVIPLHAWNALLRFASVKTLTGEAPREMAEALIAKVLSQRIVADISTYNVLLPLYPVRSAQEIFRQLRQNGRENVVFVDQTEKPPLHITRHTYEAMLDCYCRRGEAEEAEKWVSHMSAEGCGTRTPGCLNSLLVLYAVKGDVDAAYNLIESLLDDPPSEGGLSVTIVSRFVKMCSSLSLKTGDRCDRLVSFVWEASLQEGILESERILDPFFEHYVLRRNKQQLNKLHLYARQAGLRTPTDRGAQSRGKEDKRTDVFDGLLSSKGKERGKAAPDVFQCPKHNATVVLSSLKKGRWAEVVTHMGSMAKLSASNNVKLRDFLLHTTQLAVNQVLSEGFTDCELTCQGVALCLICLSVASSLQILHTEALLPLKLVTPFSKPAELQFNAGIVSTIVAELTQTRYGHTYTSGLIQSAKAQQDAVSFCFSGELQLETSVLLPPIIPH